MLRNLLLILESIIILPRRVHAHIRIALFAFPFLQYVRFLINVEKIILLRVLAWMHIVTLVAFQPQSESFLPISYLRIQIILLRFHVTYLLWLLLMHH